MCVVRWPIPKSKVTFLEVSGSNRVGWERMVPTQSLHKLAVGSLEPVHTSIQGPRPQSLVDGDEDAFQCASS